MKRTLKIFALILVASLLALTLTSCTPASIDAAKSKMINAGYSVEDYALTPNNAVGGIYAYKGALFSSERVTVTAILYETTQEAVNAVNNAIFDTGSIADGRWVYWGDEAAIKDFTKLF